MELLDPFPAGLADPRLYAVETAIDHLYAISQRGTLADLPYDHGYAERSGMHDLDRVQSKIELFVTDAEQEALRI